MPMVSFNIRLYTSEPLENGKYPIVLQISWRDKKPQIRRKRLGLSCTETEWNRDNHYFKDDVWGCVKKNAKIQEALEKAESIFRKMQSWDYKEWAREFEGNQEEKMTFDRWADQLCKEYNDRGQAGTSDHYRDAKRSLQNFMGKETIYFEEITETVLGDLERHQIANGFIGRRNFVGLKVIIGAAVKRKVINKELMPFYCGYNPTGYSFSHLDKVKIPQKRNTSKWIKRLGNETSKVLDYVSDTPSSQRDMDLWRFSYYTMGTDLKDIALMKFSDIEDGLWFYNREKTGEGGLGKPLIKEALEIVLTYYNPKNKYVFDWIMENGKYDTNDRTIRDRINTVVNNLRRRYMQISDELELNGHFAWRSARYSSASNVVNRGGNVKDVQVLMDHSSVTTTERYARYANHQKMKETLELLSK